MIPAILLGVLIIILIIQILVCLKVKSIWKWFIPIGVIALIVLGAYLGLIVFDNSEPSWHAIGRSIVMVMIIAEACAAMAFSIAIYIIFGIVRLIQHKKASANITEAVD